MAKLANKRIYIIKERASRERHADKNTDLCSVRENKDILQGRQTLYSYLQALIYSLTNSCGYTHMNMSGLLEFSVELLNY